MGSIVEGLTGFFDFRRSFSCKGLSKARRGAGKAFKSIAGRIGKGAQIAARTGIAPIVFGLRVLNRSAEPDTPGVPPSEYTVGAFWKGLLDEFFFASEIATATLVSLSEFGRVGQEMSDAVELFEERGWLKDPVSYHEDPPPASNVLLDHTGSFRGSYHHLRFESGYLPHAEEPGFDRWNSYGPNRTAHAWVLEHPGPPRPWLVCVPGYRMGRPTIDFTGFRAHWLHQEFGINIAIPVMPLHGPRSVGNRTGDGFLSGDFLDTIHAQTQAVWDIRRLIGWLRDGRGAPRVGTYGVSLGGYTAALLAALQGDLDCVIAGIPATDFVRLVRGHLPDMMLKGADRIGFGFDSIEKIFKVISPLAIPPNVPRDRCFLYAGRSDRLTPPEQAHDLWEHWERPRISWYDGGHVSFLWEQKIETLLREALGSCGLIVAKEA
jgi:hypothetical protein